MASLSDLLQTGAASIGLLLSSALVLGALHGLEPGHSKTMMTAFIIAVRGTVAQAVLLGLAATVSHTAVVWVVALLGLHFASLRCPLCRALLSGRIRRPDPRHRVVDALAHMAPATVGAQPGATAPTRRR